LKNKLLACIYPHAVDSKGFDLTVGVLVFSFLDSTLIYSLSPYGWVPADSGIGYSPVNEGIVTINGFTYPENNRMMLAGGACYDGFVFRRSNLLWENTTFYDNSMSVGVARFSPNGDDVWIGSGWDCATVWKSTDKGYTWTFMSYYCPMSGCRDIAFHPNNPDIVYIALSSGPAIHKTTDGGLIWQNVGGGAGDLAINPFDGDHVFAGSCHSWLYETTDGGLNWDTIPKPVGADYITDLEINLTDSLELYMVTDSTGVYRLTQPSLACGRVVNVSGGLEHAISAKSCARLL
jgi:hypothetical protein